MARRHVHLHLLDRPSKTVMSPLKSLNTDTFRALASSISGADGLYDYLSNCREVLALKHALFNETVTTNDIETFVRAKSTKFRPGRKFSEDIVLAAVAVALSTFPGKFADKFLTQLSSINAREMPLAPRVSGLALKQRATSVATVTTRNFTLTKAPLQSPPVVVFNVWSTNNTVYLAEPTHDLANWVDQSYNPDQPRHLRTQFQGPKATTQDQIARYGTA